MSERAYHSNPLLTGLVAVMRDSSISPEFRIRIREALTEDFEKAVRIGEGHHIAALKDALADIPDPTQP